jgi:hypothetical protein
MDVNLGKGHQKGLEIAMEIRRIEALLKPNLKESTVIVG